MTPSTGSSPGKGSSLGEGVHLSAKSAATEEPPDVSELVRLACMAPSVHNSQPWLWAADGPKLHLFADYRRRLAHTDPDNRDLVISCGAALHHLSVAAAGLGWRTHISRRPNQVNKAYLASVTFERHAIEPAGAALLAALRRRHTDRRPTAPTPLHRDDLDPLLGATAHLGVVAIAVVSAPARAAVLHLLTEADTTQRRDPAYLAEIRDWIDRGGGEGIPSANLLRHGPAHTDATTRFPSGHLADLVPGREPPALLAICTSSDNPESRLRAGEALSAVLLHGELAGLAMVPLSQTTEITSIRALLQDQLLGGDAEPQILVKVGRPTEPHSPAPPTPRRPVADVLVTLDELPAILPPS